MKKNLVRKILANNLRELMITNKHSECYLHKKTGLSQSTIGRILKEECSATVDSIEAIARFYKLEAWELLQEKS